MQSNTDKKSLDNFVSENRDLILRTYYALECNALHLVKDSLGRIQQAFQKAGYDILIGASGVAVGGFVIAHCIAPAIAGGIFALETFALLVGLYIFYHGIKYLFPRFTRAVTELVDSNFSVKFNSL